MEADRGHRVVEEWMGEQVETLADLLRPGLRAVLVGINPSPVSVAAGHDFQGPAGRRQIGRLRDAGLLPDAEPGREDDAAFAAGIGFTDIVKRPTARGHHLRPGELEHGRAELERKLREAAPALVVFVFKATARELFGPFPGNGLVPGLRRGESEVFVMPGPFQALASADATMRTLAERLAARV